MPHRLIITLKVHFVIHKHWVLSFLQNIEILSSLEVSLANVNSIACERYQLWIAWQNYDWISGNLLFTFENTKP